MTLMTGQDCPPEFTGEVRATIVACLRSAYTEADAVYAPERGLGDRVHGIAVYDVVSMLFERDLSSVAGVNFVSRGQGPELRIGDLRVRWNKVGRGDGEYSIGTSFPRGSRAAALMVLENQQLALWPNASNDTDRALNWIVCHLGNPRDGLRAVYLAAPIEADGDRVTGWRTAIAIWNADYPDAEFPSAPTPGLPEAAPLPELEIALIEETSSVDASG
jgi:hypothetical protein